MGSGSSSTFKRASSAQDSEAERAAWHRRAERLYEDLRRPAKSLVRRAYGSAFDDDEIEDIYSSAWLGTLRALERRNPELDDDEIRRYLLTAVANHAGKELRRRRRKPIAPLEAAGAVADARESPEDRVTSGESVRVTRDVLSSLPPRRRAVMLLRYGWGLGPSEVCGMVDGLSPRAYRKEITKGVDELAAKIKLVEEGRWCAEREALLKEYASGLADEDQVLQAQHHLSHCRPCHEFVGKLTGHLHDIGSALLVPGALEAVDPHMTLVERGTGTFERVRDGIAGAASRAETADGMAIAANARGAGAVGAGLAAKLAGLGVAGKAALVCLGTGALTAVCVVSGVIPGVNVGTDDRVRAASPERADAVRLMPPRSARLAQPVASAPRETSQGRTLETAKKTSPAGEGEATTSVSPAVEPSTPPVQQEFGVPAAAPAPSPASAPGGAASAQDVQQEFGP